MPPGKKGQASSLGQNKVHFHKYNLILLLLEHQLIKENYQPFTSIILYCYPLIQFLHIQVKKGVYCGNTDFHKPALPIHLM